MKLIFLLEKSTWFAEYEQAWYRIESNDEVALALGVMSLQMVSQQHLIEQPHIAGQAVVTEPDECSLDIQLICPVGTPVKSLNVKLDASALILVDWHAKRYSDGWVNSETMVTLDNVGNMYLDTYLPPCENSQGKMLTIRNTDSGSTVDVWLAREKTTRVTLVEQGKQGKVRLSLTCEAEEIGQACDSRQLGFVMLDEEALPA